MIPNDLHHFTENSTPMATEMVQVVAGGVALAVVVAVLLNAIKAATRGKHKAAPRLTLKGHAANWLLWPEALLKRKPEFQRLTFEALQKEATRKTKKKGQKNSGLTDFGETWYETAYKHAVQMLQDKQLSPLGKYIAFESIAQRLKARLRFQDELKQLPASVMATPLKDPPVFVLGLPRTGTTFLHRLLSLDPTSRCPQTYELVDVVPVVKGDTVKDKKKRIGYVQRAIDQLKSIVPHIDAIHEVGAEEAEECFLAICMDIPLVLVTMPIYMENKELLDAWDFAHLYRNYEKVLKMLTHQQGSHDKRWVLKSPMHLMFIKELRSVFRGARIIWTHRDPCQSIPSMSSFFQTMVELHEGGDVDLDRIGKSTLDFWAEALKRADAAVEGDKEAGEKEKTYQHVKYENLIKDPIGVVKGIYAAYGWTYSAEYNEILEAHIKADREKRAKKGFGKGKNKKHAYSLDMYGLTEAQVQAECAGYIGKYLS